MTVLINECKLFNAVFVVVWPTIFILLECNSNGKHANLNVCNKFPGLFACWFACFFVVVAEGTGLKKIINYLFIYWQKWQYYTEDSLIGTLLLFRNRKAKKSSVWIKQCIKQLFKQPIKECIKQWLKQCIKQSIKECIKQCIRVWTFLICLLFFQVRRQRRQHIQVKIDYLQNESRDITEFQIKIAFSKIEQL